MEVSFTASEEREDSMHSEPASYRGLSGPLFHYTSIEVFQSIFESRKMRATNVGYMNDSMELELGFTILRGLVERRIEETSGRDQSALGRLLRWIETERQPLEPVFAMCFSEVGNMLSQWRGYTPHGRGVAIAFKHVALIELAVRAGWQWFSCAYDEESQTKWMRAILMRFEREVATADPDADWQYVVEQAFARCATDIFVCAAHVKHSAFREEREWRLLSPHLPIGDPRIRYRPGKTTLVPFIELSLVDDKQHRLPIDSIVVGPTPHAQMSVSSLRGFQQSTRPNDAVVVDYCEIPFREV